MKTIRCAIYTRKSSEEGLEQAFNSLDAQREACAAYVLSQASEGWSALPDIYDDGGLSGGSLERPALQRLLGEVAAGRVDIIVVYKVDRLTRSLLDFSRLVEAFDKAGTSFVSVTQSFNTTTSMGRLTLNMLLSFAQFEREVTAERIRDKIAASKAKGMWMGGTPPIGYAPDGRSLVIVEPHAKVVRHIFERYLELGNVRLVTERLARDQVRSPRRERAKSGSAIGGINFSRGQIYAMLKSPTYVGQVAHRGNLYPGLHPPIIDREIWDKVQAQLAGNLQGRRTGAFARSPSVLAGKVIDDTGRPLIPTHATKPAPNGGQAKVRYRYYVAQAAHCGEGPGIRVPARELEALVIGRLHEELADAFALADKASLAMEPHDVLRLHAETLTPDKPGIIALIEQVRISPTSIDILCSAPAIAALLRLPAPEGTATLMLHCEARLTRSGRVVRLIDGRGTSAAATPDTTLLRLIAKAHRWWRDLRTGEIGIRALADREGVQASYITRVLRLAFLSPAVIEAVLAGKQSSAATIRDLTLGAGVDPNWDAQLAVLVMPAIGAGITARHKVVR